MEMVSWVGLEVVALLLILKFCSVPISFCVVPFIPIDGLRGAHIRRYIASSACYRRPWCRRLLSLVCSLLFHRSYISHKKITVNTNIHRTHCSSYTPHRHPPWTVWIRVSLPCPSHVSRPAPPVDRSSVSDLKPINNTIPATRRVSLSVSMAQPATVSRSFLRQLAPIPGLRKQEQTIY